MTADDGGLRFEDEPPATLGRLTSATSASSTSSRAWGQFLVYDPSGNLLQQNVTSGSAPAMNVTVDPNTNRITTSGFTYDAAGNLTQMPAGSGVNTLAYDSENRLAQATYSGAGPYTLYYGVNGERIFDGWNWHYYGPDGTHLGMIGLNYNRLSSFTDEIQFAGRLVWQKNFAVVTDRLGSVVEMSKWDGVDYHGYHPYGASIAGLPGAEQNLPRCWPNCGLSSGSLDVAFGTYHRDSRPDGNGPTTGLDYAMHRYYDRARGRFTSPDPAASGEISRPNSWNRYAYTEGDPINNNDSMGLWVSGVGGGGSSGGGFGLGGPYGSVDLCREAVSMAYGGGDLYGAQHSYAFVAAIAGCNSMFSGGMTFFGAGGGASSAVDASTNANARGLLKTRLQNFQASNCWKVLSHEGVKVQNILDNYSIEDFYDVREGSAYAGLTLSQIGLSSSSTWTLNAILGKSDARTVGGLGSTATTAVLVGDQYFFSGNTDALRSNSLLHEMLHALGGFTDTDIQQDKYFLKNGLVNYGGSNTGGISDWLSRDCK